MSKARKYYITRVFPECPIKEEKEMSLQKFINTVTVTGADNSVKPQELAVLQQDYPFAEFGILLSVSRSGSSRFPGKAWLEELADIPDLHLSGHICGQMVRDIYQGKWEVPFSPIFERFQLNTHGHAHPYTDGVLKCLQEHRCILQFDGTNDTLLADAVAKSIHVETLFDFSHGAGRLPTDWPAPIEGVYCGYAGGLSHANVTTQITKLENTIGTHHKIWIDAETHLRSKNDSVFDLKKVQQFLEAAKPWVNV